jgi:beta-glucosidase
MGSTDSTTTTPDPAADERRETAVEQALGKLDLTGKAALLAGTDMWSLAADERIGLGRLVMSDGPAGVRGEQWGPEDPSVAIPSPTALAATWDLDLVRRTGALLAQEARRKGVRVVLAPTVNLHRSPRGGRHFEAYSEDPLLTGEVGAALVDGIQSGGVAATPKHWVANDSETDRYTVDVRADERTLRELYLAPFEAIVRKAGPWALMAAYNQVGGHRMSEHDALNNAVLRGEWGFDGALVSDWTGARDTVRAALGGLDVAMPGPATVYGEHLVAAVRDGRVPEQVVDALARRVLRLAARVGLLAEAPAVVPEHPAEIDGEALAREVAARSFTLVRNDGVLPLDPAPGSVALIGAAAGHARIGGGGSAQVFPARVVSPLEGLRSALPPSTALGYALGADPSVHLAPLAGPVDAALLDADGGELATTELPDGGVRWLGQLPGGVGFAELRAVRLTGLLQPRTTGLHRLAIRGQGRFVLEANGRTVFDGELRYQGADPAGAFLNPPEEVFELDLESTVAVKLTLRHMLPEQSAFAGFGLVSFALGYGEPVGTADELIDEAVALAAAADVAVVVVATTEEVESEGVDRVGLALPGRQDELVHRIARVNPRTVVVVNSGAPVLMPWRDEVAAVLLAWFPGQEAGAALGEVLLGVSEPGGRLPTTWPAEEADCPVWQVEPVDGRLDYREGLFVGYPAWQRRGTAAPAYWFGHGLGYTDWEYQGVEVRLTGAGPGADADVDGDGDAGRRADPYAARALAVVRLRNTGARSGRETVQVYLRPDGSDPSRPDRRLAGFAVVQAGPGEVVEARVELPLRAFQTWGADGADGVDGAGAPGWSTRAGAYTVEAGRSAADARVTAALHLPDAG